MNILIADKFEAAATEALCALGCNVISNPDLSPETIADAANQAQADIVIVRSTKVPSGAIEAMTTVKGIIRAGAGYDNIDCDAAADKGIAVCNCPGMNAVAVAELAFAHLLCCDRRIPDQCNQLAAGTWNKKEFAKARGLKGSTLGIVGVGYIGKALIQRAKAFDMNILAWSRSMTPAVAADLGVTPGGSTRDDLLKMLAQCDAISVHVAGTAETKNMCNEVFFNAMKPGAYFINTARGSVVDEAALLSAVQTKGIRAGLDVYQNQPATPNEAWQTPIAGVPGIYTSHHCGASTDQAQTAVGEEAVRIIKVFQNTGSFENRVNEPAAAAS